MRPKTEQQHRALFERALEMYEQGYRCVKVDNRIILIKQAVGIVASSYGEVCAKLMMLDAPENLLIFNHLEALTFDDFQ